MNTLLFAATLATNVLTTAELPTVIVEASRLDRTPHDLPQAVQVITAAEITQSGARDLVEVLTKKAPQLHVSGVSGENPAMKQLSMAGYGENGFGRLLVTVDGERLNNPDMSAPNLAQIDLHSIRRIEILTGPQCVLHGDAASAGLINIITEPEDYDTHGHLEVRGGSWNTFGVSAGLSGGIAETGTQYWANGGWEMSDGARENSEYRIWNANGGVKENFENGAYVKISAFYNHDKFDLPRPLPRASWRAETSHSAQKERLYQAEQVDNYSRETYGLNATALGVINEENRVRLTTTYSRRDTKSETYGRGGYDDYDYNTWAYLGWMDYVWASLLHYEMESVSVTPEWINESELAGLSNELLVGATLSFDRLRVTNDSPTSYFPRYAAPSYLDPFHSDSIIERLTAGAYAQDTLHLTEQVAVQLGGRVAHAENHYTSALFGRQGRALYAYEGALLFTPTEDLKTYARFGEFYRNPFLDENPYNGGSTPLRILEPETGWNTSVGADWHFLEAFDFSANAYTSRTYDEVFYNPFYSYNTMWGSWTKDNVNSPNPVNRNGFMTSLAWEREKTAGLSIAYAYTDARFDGGQFGGKKVPFVPESTLALNGRVWLWDECAIFGGYRYQTKMYTISDFRNAGSTRGTYGNLPSFGIFHLGLSYAPTCCAALKGWTVSILCNNLFDKKYCDYASYGSNYWPAARRSLMATVRYDF